MKKFLRKFPFFYFLKSIILPIDSIEKRLIRGNLIKYFLFCIRDKSKFIIISSFPSSGWNYFNKVINEYINLKYNEKNKQNFLTIDGSAALEKKKLEESSMMNTHYCYFEIPFFFSGKVTKNYKIIISRNYISTLYSYYKKYKRVESFEEFIKKGNSLKRIVDFYNSWSENLVKSKKFVILKYENLRNEPLKEFKKAANILFNDKINDNDLLRAIEKYDFELVKKRKIQKDKAEIDMFMGKNDYSEMIEKKTLNYLRNYLKINLNKETIDIFNYEI